MSPRAVPSGARRAPATLLRPLLLAVVALLLGAPACADPAADARAAAVAAAREALAADDASEALRLSKEALNDHGDDPALRETAAAACVALERYADAATHARAGLDAEPDDADLVADLEFQFGKASLGRYRGVRAAKDWSVANLALQRATDAGRHRVEAATLLVAMQFMDGRNNRARAEKYAELVQQLQPDGASARTVAKILAAETDG